VAERQIPDKPYFKIGEVADIVGVKASVLRYWETEFKSIKPEKTRTNQRVYSRKGVERILRIRELLYDKGFTIAGARRKLREPGPDQDELADEGEGAEGGTAGEGAPAGSLRPARQQQAIDKAIRETRELLRLCDD
jgi:DNA-binding transcriptional MerR regulator